MKSLLIILLSLSSLNLWAQGPQDSMSSHLQQAFDKAINQDTVLKVFLADLNKKYDCHAYGDYVVNCEISLKVEERHTILLNYQYSTPTLNETYRTFHFVFNQGTQQYNHVVFTVDYKVTSSDDGKIQAEVVSFSEL